jgi:hypothetical protein
MKRIQIQLDESTYEALRRRAFQEKRSLSSLIRKLLAEALDTGGPARRRSLKEFASVGAGRSRQGRLSPVSERHDEALADALEREHRR